MDQLSMKAIKKINVNELNSKLAKQGLTLKGKNFFQS